MHRSIDRRRLTIGVVRQRQLLSDFCVVVLEPSPEIDLQYVLRIHWRSFRTKISNGFYSVTLAGVFISTAQSTNPDCLTQVSQKQAQRRKE
jgi:hypothetical protein